MKPHHEAEFKRPEEIPERYLCCDMQRKAAQARAGVRIVIDMSYVAIENITCNSCGRTHVQARGAKIVKSTDPKQVVRFTRVGKTISLVGCFVVLDYLHIDEKPTQGETT